MSQLEKSLQSIERGRYIITWLASRADILFFAYRCLDFVTSTHEPLKRTSEVLESFLPEINPDSDKTTNDQNVVELREGRVFRSMQSSGYIIRLLSYTLVTIFWVMIFLAIVFEMTRVLFYIYYQCIK